MAFSLDPRIGCTKYSLDRVDCRVHNNAACRIHDCCPVRLLPPDPAQAGRKGVDLICARALEVLLIAGAWPLASPTGGRGCARCLGIQQLTEADSGCHMPSKTGCESLGGAQVSV